MKNFFKSFIRSDNDMVILRLSVITIFMLFGTYKWFDFEVMALEPIISSTWLNILYILFGVHGGSYFLGVMETLTFLALIIGFFRPAAGVLDQKTQELISLAVAVTTRCDGCISIHSQAALKAGASREEIAAALAVAVSLNAGAAVVYSSHVMEAINQ